MFAGKPCSAVSPLPEDFHANFGGDPFTGDTPDYFFKRQVLHRNGASCGTVHNRTGQRAPDVINLKLHHKQMHYQRSPFLNVFTQKTMTIVVEKVHSPAVPRQYESSRLNIDYTITSKRKLRKLVEGNHVNG